MFLFKWSLGGMRVGCLKTVMTALWGVCSHNRAESSHWRAREIASFVIIRVALTDVCKHNMWGFASNLLLFTYVSWRELIGYIVNQCRSLAPLVPIEFYIETSFWDRLLLHHGNWKFVSISKCCDEMNEQFYPISCESN